ncbi:MAG: hypothetical protein A2133_05105 [Actinobacteria bacterium RBG_16_64_13]|nr:MAG: hypothetical protein A2133_05105 [Actinobacteria bacterium RBG_16_64_13]
MNDAALTALKCFRENLRDFGDARTQPENYNLYNGLANLAEAIGALQVQVLALSQEVQELRRGRRL